MKQQAGRKIIHCDCDCFYAAIEVRDRPELRGKPVAVGGTGGRGVVATCNYEAREFGVHSAMPSAVALRRCPDLIILPTNMEKYRAVSRQISAIYRDYTTLIEPLSLDEAYLDVTGSRHFNGSATLIAREIRRRVREQTGITLSAGIAPNKFLAKVASDWNKPDGQFVIRPEQVEAFVEKLPVRKLFGVGKVTAARLNDLGIQTCGDLRAFSETYLVEHFGRFGYRLYELCRGIDRREVRSDRIRKSLSVETTYTRDLPDIDACLNELPALYEQMLERLQPARSRYRISKAFVKLRFNTFVSTTVERLAEDTDPRIYDRLLREGWERHARPVRLIGLGVRLLPIEAAPRNVAGAQTQQLPLL